MQAVGFSGATRPWLFGSMTPCACIRAPSQPPWSGSSNRPGARLRRKGHRGGQSIAEPVDDNVKENSDNSRRSEHASFLLLTTHIDTLRSHDDKMLSLSGSEQDQYKNEGKKLVTGEQQANWKDWAKIPGSIAWLPEKRIVSMSFSLLQGDQKFLSAVASFSGPPEPSAYVSRRPGTALAPRLFPWSTSLNLYIYFTYLPAQLILILSQQSCRLARTRSSPKRQSSPS